MAIDWPTEHEDHLRDLWSDKGHSASACARLLNEKFNATYTRSGVLGKARRLKLPKRNENQNASKSKVATRVIKPRRTVITETFMPKFGTGTPEVKPAQHIDLDEPTDTHHKTFAEAEDGDCKWPVGDGVVCGRPTPNKRKPYCVKHASEGRGTARPYIRWRDRV